MRIVKRNFIGSIRWSRKGRGVKRDVEGKLGGGGLGVLLLFGISVYFCFFKDLHVILQARSIVHYIISDVTCYTTTDTVHVTGQISETLFLASFCGLGPHCVWHFFLFLQKLLPLGPWTPSLATLLN